MKKKFLWLPFLAATFLFYSCGGDNTSDGTTSEGSEDAKRTPTKDEMIALNNDLVAKQNKLFDDYDQFFVVVKTQNVDAIERQLEDWKEDTKEVLEDIKEMEDFEETAEFKQALVDIAEFQNEFVNNEAAEITEFFKNINDYTDEAYDAELQRLKDAIGKFEDEFLVYNDVFVSEQKKFAKQQDIILVAD